MRLDLQRRVGKSRQRGLEHLRGRVAADLGGADDFPFAIARLDFRESRDVAGAHPFACALVAKAKRIKLDRHHGTAV